ncbi:FMN-binding protein [Streptomyces sp. S07_1.15]|uniref:FMN-binding protein n=1 Tax=Streptomyces sp. S07_1.15 TaxID=2873925 RepID=UPI001D142479|nr:FMN-binding protein [Streptomyces sp. S07_1.15]MCC3652941.1 FMN-binding protein [Streptomyces sp. S07_1.15]
MRNRHPYRRTVLAAAGTVSVIVALLALKPDRDPALARAGGPGTPSTAAVSPAQPSSPSPSSASAKPSKSTKRASAEPSPSPPAPRTTAPAPARTSRAPAAPETTTAPPATRSVTGDTVRTEHGPVQVRITLTGSRITAAAALQSPAGDPRSEQISSTAIPRLNQDTLAAQSADIDTVSGATYTSDGYRQSLQSALDRAGL